MTILYKTETVEMPKEWQDVYGYHPLVPATVSLHGNIHGNGFYLTGLLNSVTPGLENIETPVSQLFSGENPREIQFHKLKEAITAADELRKDLVKLIEESK